MPVVTPGGSAVFTHALLHHAPLTGIGYNKAVQVQLKSILYGGIVNLGAQLTATHKMPGIHAGTFTYLH